MKKILGNIKSNLRIFGIDINLMKNAFRGLPTYLEEYNRLKTQKGADTSFPFGDNKLMLVDRFLESGAMRGHYFHQDIYVAQKIFQSKPVKHVDIGSRIDGFVAHVAAFREIEVFDIRELNSTTKNIRFKQADLMILPKGMVDYCDSLSALHSIEHFGLGRYGDPVDYFGHIKALENIYLILKKGGKFYFSVPIGKQRIEFNAHRVFSVNYLVHLLEKQYTIDSFAYVDDRGDLHENKNVTSRDASRNFGCNYGCGIFELTKK